MNADRRAALQRKLAVAPVPKPPAGLAARIKNQIPKELRFSAERERARLNQSVRLSIAVAASVIVVIATAYLALDVTTRSKVDETTKPAAAPAIRQTQTPRLQVPAPAAPPAPQVVAEKQPARTRAKKQEEKRAEAAQESVAERPAVSFTQPAADGLAKAAPAAAAAAAPVAANAVKEEVTRSPISGKLMAREGTRALDATSLKDVKLTEWKNASRETKIEILKAELARGAEPGEVARVAREAGLNEFADSIEKKKQQP